MMIRLQHALNAWSTPAFERTLKSELQEVALDALPLQQGLRHGSHALEEGVELMVIGAEELAEVIRVRLGVHYRSLIAGCSCADDPTPLDTLAEYCVLRLDIDKHSGALTIRLLEED